MALLGQAALAMWWDIAPAVRADFENWHAHEHFPERMALPGFRRGTRWSSAAGGEGMFVLYELERHETLASPAYLARLNAPTPWSTRLMPEHRNMVRSQCRVVASHGAVVARHALPLRLSAEPDRDDELQAFLGATCAALASRPGLVGAHLLRHQAPPIGRTKEQEIRNNADQSADLVMLVCGYEAAVLHELAGGDLSAERLRAQGAEPSTLSALYTLSCSATGADVA